MATGFPQDDEKKKKNSFGDAAAALADVSVQRIPTAGTPTPQQGVTGTWQDQPPQQGVTGTWPAAAPKSNGLYPYNMPGKDIYAGAGKPSSAPENTPLPGSITGGGAPSTRTVAAPAPATPQQGVTGTWDVPSPAPTQVQTGVAGFMPGARAVMSGVGDDVSGNIKSGNYAEAAGNVGRGMLATLPALADDVVGGFAKGAYGLAKNPVEDFGRALVGASPRQQESIPAGNSTAGAGRGTTPDPRATNASVVPNPLQDNPAAPASPATPANNITREGNSYSGNNISNGFTINGQPPRNGGAISAQNQSAAQAMSDRYQAEAVRGFQPGAQAGSELTAAQRAGNFTPAGGDTGGFGLLDRSAREKRNADVTMSSITANKTQKQVAAAEYAAINARDAQAAGEAGNMARFGMQDATARRGQDAAFSTSQAGNALARQRLGLEGQELGLKQTAAGFQNRAAARMESLQAAYEAAPADQKSAIAEQLRVLSGKDKPAQWKGIALQGSTDAMGNKTEGVLAAVNEQTGESRRLDQGGAAVQAKSMPPKVQLVKGQTYQTPRGPARWDGAQFVPA